MRILPASLDELQGLRFARYRRESTDEQGSKYGPGSQDAEIEYFVGHYGLVDTGLTYLDLHSGWHRSEERTDFQRMLTDAGDGAFDVLVVAFGHRFARDAELTLRTRRELHARGIVVAFADERILSSDRSQWDRFLDAAVSAEKYSWLLGRSIEKAYRAKFERHGDQGGTAGLGFRRTPQPEARLVIDPETMPRAVAIFERYATGDVSHQQLEAKTGIRADAIRAMLANPLYNGWAVRHRRSPRQERRPAPWRDNPPVSDDLWARVQEIRSSRRRGGGARQVRVHLLARRAHCAECGERLRCDTANPKGYVYRRLRHVHRCPAWPVSTRRADPFEQQISEQLAGIRLHAENLVRLRALAAEESLPSPATDQLRRRQLERDLADIALRHASRQVTTDAYLAEHARLSAELDELAKQPARQEVVDADTAIAWLRDLKRAWASASDEARARLVRAVYRRISINAEQVVEVELTPEAYRHQLDQVLPVYVTGAPGRSRPDVGHNRPSVRIRIVGRAERARARGRSA